MARTRQIMLAVGLALLLVLGLRLSGVGSMHARLVARARFELTQRHAWKVVQDLMQYQRICGCAGLPIPEGAEVQLGSARDRPGPLLQELMRAGEVESARVCDAWGQPMLVRGISAVEVAACSHSLPKCDPSDQCSSRHGGVWSPAWEIVSLGADGRRTPYSPGCDPCWIVDENSDLLVGFHDVNLWPPPSGPLRAYRRHAAWFDQGD